MKLEEFWVGALRRAVIEGDVERGSLMAGQSVAFAKKIQPVAEIIEELVASAEKKLAEMASRGAEEVAADLPPSFRSGLPIR